MEKQDRNAGGVWRSGIGAWMGVEEWDRDAGEVWRSEIEMLEGCGGVG